jgi:hypothetical protein
MTSAGASGTVTVENQRSYIKTETLRSKNPREINIFLREDCGEQTVDRSIVSRSATRFRERRVIINDDHWLFILAVCFQQIVINLQGFFVKML